ncbi:MAG: restriction endonuclease subunit S [archaeon]
MVTKTLDELCEIIGGIPAPKEDSSFDPKGIPFVRMQDLGRYHLTSNLMITKDSLSSEFTKNTKRGFVKAGSILMPRSGSVGLNHRAILGTDAYIVSHICALTPKSKEIYNKYLYYYLCSITMDKIVKKTTGLDAITFEDLKKIKVPVPPIEEQKKLVAVLERAEKLKERRKHASLIFKTALDSFFNKVTDESKNKQIGFLDIFNLTTGKLNSNASVANGKYPFFTCSKETFSIDIPAFDCEALLLSGNNAAAEYSVKHYKGKFNAYQRTYVLTLKEKAFCYEFFRFALERKLLELKSISFGTNTKYLTLGLLKNVKLTVPSIEVQKKFSDFVKVHKDTYSKQTQTEEEINNVFDALMQKSFGDN